MKFVINKDQLDTQPEQFLRQAGYTYIQSHKTGRESYVRRLAQGQFPRLHVYLDHMGHNVVFNVHLDQKKPSYEGSRSHAGEHDSEVVEQEVKRLKSLVSVRERVDSIKAKEEKKPKKSIWKKMFNNS